MASYETYFEEAKKSLFRFEGLQDYSAMDGEESVKSFKETGKLLVHPSDTNWWQDMRRKIELGIITERVRLVTFPLTDYTRMELTWHKEAAGYSGDDIRIIEQERFDLIFDEQIPDFWLIDNLYAFPMEYGTKGKFLCDHLVDGVKVNEYVSHKEKLLRNSVPITSYI